MAKRLTALGLDKIKRTALAEAKRKGDRLEQPIDGQGGYFIAQSSGKEPALAYRYVSPETGKRAKLTYKGPALMPAGVSKWLADQRLAVEEGRDPGAERRKAKVAARGREADTVEHWIERYIELRA